jgi:hypothetical protein
VSLEAAELIDAMLDCAIDTLRYKLRRKPDAPQFTYEQWDELFADVRSRWLQWLPQYLEEMIDDSLREEGDE